MSEENKEIFEYRGIEDLYFAKVIKDDAEGFECETPVEISAVAEIGKKTDSASESHYYDNKPVVVVNSEGPDTYTLTVAPPALKILAQLEGKSFDETTGMLVDGERINEYYAIMYKAKGTDGKYRYVSRLKGTFAIPDETHQTEDSGTGTTNIQLTYTGIYTQHEFEKGKFEEGKWEKGPAKGVVVDTRYKLADVTGFFNKVQTPDSITPTTPLLVKEGN